MVSSWQRLERTSLGGSTLTDWQSQHSSTLLFASAWLHCFFRQETSRSSQACPLGIIEGSVWYLLVVHDRVSTLMNQPTKGVKGHLCNLPCLLLLWLTSGHGEHDDVSLIEILAAEWKAKEARSIVPGKALNTSIVS